jgi:cytochrome c5
MSDQHSSPIKTPQQLVTVIVLSFVVPVLLIVLLVKFVAGEKSSGAGSSSMTPEAIAERLKPIGEVALAEAGGAKALQSGEAIYKLSCAACHAAGVAGAPKAGDAGLWAPRLKQGYDTLVKHATEGYKAMPAKGGNVDLDPIEVARAVAYLGNLAGAKFKEPDASTAAGSTHAERTGEQIVQGVCSGCHAEGKGGAPKIGSWDDWKPRVTKGLAVLTESAIHGHKGMPARGGMAEISDVEMRRAVEYMFKAHTGPASASAAAPVAVPVAAPVASSAGKADGAAGEKLYKQTCIACHAAGVAGAPKTGDKAAWAPRVKQGIDALVASAIKGKGAMPPRGTAGNATDAEIRAAVEYLVAQAK